MRSRTAARCVDARLASDWAVMVPRALVTVYSAWSASNALRTDAENTRSVHHRVAEPDGDAAQAPRHEVRWKQLS